MSLCINVSLCIGDRALSSYLRILGYLETLMIMVSLAQYLLSYLQPDVRLIQSMIAHTLFLWCSQSNLQNQLSPDIAVSVVHKQR
jgi:hypothetical protein